MNQGNMSITEYAKLRASIIRCIVMDIRDGNMGILKEDVRDAYRFVLNAIINDNIDLINEENARMVTTNQGEEIKPQKLSANDVMKIIHAK